MSLRATKFVLFLGLLVLCTDSRAVAQDATTVAFSALDSATVRVFAVGRVESQHFPANGGQRLVAIPQAGHGSGFVVGDGLIVTAQHVIEGATHLVVRLPGEGGFAMARSIYQDASRDIAVLQAPTLPGTTPLQLAPASHALRSRQTTFAVGYPLDPTRTQPQSSRGIVSGLLPNGNLQLDMALNPGNSGGPLVDEHDAVVGMVVARGNTEAGVQNIGVAVPVARLHDAIRRARGAIESRGAMEPLDDDAARVIDALMNAGAYRLMREAAEVLDHAVDSPRLSALFALAPSVEDPDLAVVLAAYLWNAGQYTLHQAGGLLHPAGLFNPEAQALVERLLSTARGLVDRAFATDEGIVRRSSFARALRSRSRVVGATLTSGGEPMGATLTSFQARHPRSGSGTLRSDGYDPRWRVAPMRGVLVHFGVAALFTIRPLFGRFQLEPYDGDRHQSPGFHIGGGYFAEPGRSATLNIAASFSMYRLSRLEGRFRHELSDGTLLERPIGAGNARATSFTLHPRVDLHKARQLGSFGVGARLGVMTVASDYTARLVTNTSQSTIGIFRRDAGGVVQATVSLSRAIFGRIPAFLRAEIAVGRPMLTGRLTVEFGAWHRQGEARAAGEPPPARAGSEDEDPPPTPRATDNPAGSPAPDVDRLGESAFDDESPSTATEGGE